MTIRRCAALLLTAQLLAACAGDDEATEGATNTESDPTEAVSTQAGAGTMRLTLTDDGCTYAGPESLGPGAFTVEVENETEYLGAFAVAGLAEGATIGDLEAYVAQAQQTWDETGTLPEPPAFYSQAVRAGVEAGQTGSLPADVPAGTYALMCFVDDLPTWRGYAAAQLEVTG